MVSHYDYLRDHLPTFFDQLDVGWEGNEGIIVAHGDKCYGYRERWADVGITFDHGTAIYLLSYVSPYAREVRDTSDGWVDPGQWVIDNYDRFMTALP